MKGDDMLIEFRDMASQVMEMLVPKDYMDCVFDGCCTSFFKFTEVHWTITEYIDFFFLWFIDPNKKRHKIQIHTKASAPSCSVVAVIENTYLFLK